MSMILSARGLVKSFALPGEKRIEVLKGVDVEVAAGEKVAILGRSGEGKSTLLHVLGGLLKPDSGEVSRPLNIGFVFQAYHLMEELTVLENVMLPTMAAGRGIADAKGRAAELLGKVGLADRMNHLPAELSGGERQRVAIARALVTAPSLVFADEPTGNLDSVTGRGILELLAGLEGVALVMVTHSAEAAGICSRNLTLAEGRLI